MQSGLIKKEDLARKYKKEIFANEIVLLAYCIASINIENVYHSLMNKSEGYKSFEGICLTYTFQLYENTIIEEKNKLMLENSDKIKKQKKSKITIVIGNPPYSKGQKLANDNNQNQHYKNWKKK